MSKIGEISIEKYIKKGNQTFIIDMFLKQCKAKNISMALFIVLWPCLLTTKLSCLQTNYFGHTNVGISYALSIYISTCDLLMCHVNYLGMRKA